MPNAECAADTRRRWSTTRILFALAGTMTLANAALAATVSPWFLILGALVGANQWLYAGAGWCPASLIIDRLRRDRDPDTFPGIRPIIES